MQTTTTRPMPMTLPCYDWNTMRWYRQPLPDTQTTTFNDPALNAGWGALAQEIAQEAPGVYTRPQP